MSLTERIVRSRRILRSRAHAGVAKSGRQRTRLPWDSVARSRVIGRSQVRNRALTDDEPARERHGKRMSRMAGQRVVFTGSLDGGLGYTPRIPQEPVLRSPGAPVSASR
jgi:hypothetical protein